MVVSGGQWWTVADSGGQWWTVVVSGGVDIGRIDASSLIHTSFSDGLAGDSWILRLAASLMNMYSLGVTSFTRLANDVT